MTIIVQLCGRLADVAGCELRIEDDAAIHSITDLRHAIASAHPGLAADMMSHRVHACVDDQIVRDTRIIGAGATVAFFPPLSGG